MPPGGWRYIDERSAPQSVSDLSVQSQGSKNLIIKSKKKNPLPREKNPRRSYIPI
jgi:hypothetical protein